MHCVSSAPQLLPECTLVPGVDVKKELIYYLGFCFVLKKFISVQDILIEYIHQSVVLHITYTSLMSRTDGASWSHF
jgi:hypothetical protein